MSNQAAEHELRVALRSINNMKHAAAQAHDQQRYKFLGSLSDDIFAENVEPEFPAKRLQQRRKSSSHGEIELPNIQKKSSPVNLSPTKSPPCCHQEMRIPQLQGGNCQMAKLKGLRLIWHPQWTFPHALTVR